MFAFLKSRSGGSGTGKALVVAGASAEARARFQARALGRNPRKSMSSEAVGSVASFLVKNDLLEPAQARAAAMDARARGTPIGTILAEQGAVPRDKIVEAIESVDVGMLAASVDFDVRLPRQMLRDYKICVHAQTDTKIMISTMSAGGSLVAQAAIWSRIDRS